MKINKNLKIIIKIIFNIFYIILVILLGAVINIIFDWDWTRGKELYNMYTFSFLYWLLIFLSIIVPYVFIRFFIKNIYLVIVATIYILIFLYDSFILVNININFYKIDIYSFKNSWIYYLVILLFIYFIWDFLYCIYTIIRKLLK